MAEIIGRSYIDDFDKVQRIVEYRYVAGRTLRTILERPEERGVPDRIVCETDFTDVDGHQWSSKTYETLGGTQYDITVKK